ncbi:MAG: helix-turn-helix transcriptional regulator [Veillonellales bacterium]
MMQRDYEAEYLDLGKHIAFYREKRNLSQEQLAKRVDCTPIYIRKVEGQNVATKTTLSDVWAVKKLDFLFSIADALQMDVIAFFKPMTEEYFQEYRRDH